MANAHIHSKSSARRFGGQLEDYLEIHIKMDCSKAYISDNRHRALTHNAFGRYLGSYFIAMIMTFIALVIDSKSDDYKRDITALMIIILALTSGKVSTFIYLQPNLFPPESGHVIVGQK